MPVEIFADTVWQMTLGERAAIEGLLAQLRPSLAIEVGSAEGACLRRIAAYADEVHSFDLHPPSLAVPPNVTLHTGDSHELLPAFLAELERSEGRTVDFALVDGDHSTAGVRRDLEDLLDSSAVADAVILFHDTANERVRAGVEAVRFERWPKVGHVELDWVPGRLYVEPALRDELWAGLGLAVIGAGWGGSIYEERYHPTGPLLERARDLPARAAAQAQVAAALRAELADIRAQLARAERALTDIKGSASWTLTAPLRAAKRRLAGR